MVVGPPGVGKSFFSRQFSDTFGAPWVNVDRLRHELFSEPNFSNDEQDILQRLVEYQAGELLKTKRSFLLDGCCNTRVQRQRIEKLAKEHGYGTLVIWVQTDPATSKWRATKRNPKRTDDQYSVSLTSEQFTTFARRFTPPTREHYVVISGKHTYSTQAKMVLRKLAGPHVTEAENAHKAENRHLGVQRPGPESRPPTRRDVIIQ